MAAALRHRGPDASGVYGDGAAALAHARLSIIDIGGGAQPMRTADGRLAITFNGEIFNFVELRQQLEARGHRFATRSDTEVILHAYDEWDERCVERFNGQWAFAIWDARRQRLFLSRDRVGIRPLFYARTPDALVFASEIKALFAHQGVPRALDPQALAQVFTFWVTLPPRTPFAGVYQLPPGHSMVVERTGSMRVQQYWDFNFTADEERAASENEYAEQLRALLADATALRLRADVPVATYVSGGLDSSITTSLVSQIAPASAAAFSVAFDDEEFDESAFQQMLASHLGVERNGIRCTAEDIARVFSDVVWHAEAPLLRMAPAPLLMLSELVRRSGYKVVVTGEGADEAFGGYDIFKEAKVRAFWARQPDSRRRPLLLRRLYPYMPALQRQPDGALRAFFHVSEDADRDPWFSHMPRWSLTSGLQLLFSAETRDALRGYEPLDDMRATVPPSFATWSVLARAQYLEAKFLLPGYILSSQGDRMAMANSVEIRMPFLDYRVIEFAGRLPERLRVKGLNEKYLLKRAMGPQLPAPIVERAKQPYRAPDGRTLATLAGEAYVQNALSPSSIGRDGIFDPQAASLLAGKLRGGRTPGTRDTMGLVGVLSTQLLVDQFVRAFDARTPPHTEKVEATA
jgi:asparagine synthase (glutamine-hydrolysing)